jgi:hypothetical protein
MRKTPNEGPVYLAGAPSAAEECIGPSPRKKRGPKDDNVDGLGNYRETKKGAPMFRSARVREIAQLLVRQQNRVHHVNHAIRLIDV